MSDDLVRRLKAIEVQPIDQFGRWLTNIHAEAAAEIERHRQCMHDAQARIATLEAELAAFRAFLTERGCGGVRDAIEGCAERDLFAKQIGEFAERSAADLECVRSQRDLALARIARLEAALRPFAEWSSGLPSKTSAAVKMYVACVNAVAALADAPEEKC